MFSSPGVITRRNRRWPSTTGHNSSDTGNVFGQPLFMPPTQQPIFSNGINNNQKQGINIYTQLHQPQYQHQPQQPLNHLSVGTQPVNSRARKSETSKEKKGKVEGLRRTIQENRNNSKEEETGDIFDLNKAGGGDEGIPDGSDEEEIVGYEVIATSSNDDESEIEIGTTVLTVDSSDFDSGSDIEISPMIQLTQRERTDSTNSVTFGITFEDAGGDESIAPDDCVSGKNETRFTNKKLNKNDAKSLIEKFNNKFKTFSTQQYRRCSFRINALIGETRKQTLSLEEKQIVIKMTLAVWNKRNIDYSDADLEYRVVNKLRKRGFLDKLLIPSTSSASKYSKTSKTLTNDTVLKTVKTIDVVQQRKKVKDSFN